MAGLRGYRAKTASACRNVMSMYHSMTPCDLVIISTFWGNYSRSLHDIRAKLKETGFPKKLVYIYQDTRRHIPQNRRP